MIDLGATFLAAMTLLIAVPSLMALWFLVPRGPKVPRDTNPTPRSVARVASSRTPRPMSRVGLGRSIR